MFIELLQAFTLIFFAEMGDKSQILAMTFASRYKLRNVLIGISVGILLNHSLAVLIGYFIPELFNIEYLSLFAGVLFVLFGLASLNITEEIKDVKKSKVGVTITIALAIFIGELGDKTQLSTIILASETSYPLLILTTTVSAMILTSLLGIYIGIKFGSKIPELALKIASSFIFILFGIIKISTSLPEMFDNIALKLALSSILVVIYILLFIRFKRISRTHESLYKQRAEELKNYYTYIKDKLEDICLGESICKTCQGNFCLLGYTKTVVRNTLNHKQVKVIDLSKKVHKEYDRNKIKEALDITINVLKDNWSNSEYHNLHEIRKSMEILLYNRHVEANTYNEYKIKKISIQ